MSPISIADKNDRRSTFSRIAGGEIPPENRLNSEDLEEPGRDDGNRGARRLRGTRNRRHVVMILCNRLKAAVLIAKVVEVRIRNAGPPAIRVDFEDGHDAVRIGVRQRAQQHAVYNAEDCRGRSNGQRERKDHDCGSTRVFPELAETIAAIGEHRAEPIAYPFLTNLFFHLFDAAEFDLCSALRFVRRHAGTNVFRYQHFEVGMNFMIEVCFHTARPEKISQEASSFLSERHIETLSMMFPRLARWPKKCGPIVWFRLRVASVRLCSNDSISRGGYFRTLPRRRKSNLLLPFGAERERASLA